MKKLVLLGSFAWICYSQNSFGQHFWYRDWTFWRARNGAMNICQYNSPYYSRCYVTGCQQYW